MQCQPRDGFGAFEMEKMTGILDDLDPGSGGETRLSVAQETRVDAAVVGAAKQHERFAGGGFGALSDAGQCRVMQGGVEYGAVNPQRVADEPGVARAALLLACTFVGSILAAFMAGPRPGVPGLAVRRWLVIMLAAASPITAITPAAINAARYPANRAAGGAVAA
ncbi:MAG: hypothetical protein ACRDPY_12595 [Streptosporangiaceae bacterium]